ncbi:MAG: di-trans,poly-cis-decaprenylcistransferase [Clostridiales bacterium]|nr:di-trans,poly-cis-decaprenylcistransferase [Clostridiales bacterium]
MKVQKERGEIAYPRHIAVIMDGNGRWAKKRLLPRGAGHRAGLKRMIELTEHAFLSGAQYLTLYALSTENLQRPKEELDGLYALFRDYFSEHVEKLVKKDIRLRVIGDISLLPEDIVSLIRDGEGRTAEGKRGLLILAIAYGARQEIVSAVNQAVRAGEEVDEEKFSSLLYTEGVPAPDLLIRTGKEKRLSNFLLWQSAYSELYFSDKMFPDFKCADFDKAVSDYLARDRRYGKV